MKDKFFIISGVFYLLFFNKVFNVGMKLQPKHSVSKYFGMLKSINWK